MKYEHINNSYFIIEILNFIIHIIFHQVSMNDSKRKKVKNLILLKKDKLSIYFSIFYKIINIFLYYNLLELRH